MSIYFVCNLIIPAAVDPVYMFTGIYIMGVCGVGAIFLIMATIFSCPQVRFFLEMSPSYPPSSLRPLSTRIHEQQLLSFHNLTIEVVRILLVSLPQHRVCFRSV